MRPNALSFLLPTLLLLPLSLLGGCRSVPERTGANVQQIFRGDLENVRPLDIVVAPLLNESMSENVPVEKLRKAFHRGLVKRLYSPLGLEYVDSQVVEAAYRTGSLHEDAVLEVAVIEWDDSRWGSHNAIEVKIEARMVDASGRVDPGLWGARLGRKFALAKQLESFATEGAMIDHICQQIAGELLHVMPARTPTP